MDPFTLGVILLTKWCSDHVKPYHNEIIQARSHDGGGSNDNNKEGLQTRSSKHRVNAIKRNKNKLKKLNQKIAAAKTELESLNEEGEDKKVQFEDQVNQNAGDSFGRKKSKKKKE